MKGGDPRTHPWRRGGVHDARVFRANGGRNGGSMREGVNGRAAGHPGSENPEKYVIVSSTVITKNRTNERRNERLNVARVGVRAFPPSPASLPLPLVSPFSPSRMDTSLPFRFSSPSFPALFFFPFFVQLPPPHLCRRCSHCALLIPVYCRPKQ